MSRGSLLRSVVAVLVCASFAFAQDADNETITFGDLGDPPYDVEFFPGVQYDATIPSPESVLGRPLGSWPASHAEVKKLWEAWAAASPRARLESHGKTFEGRAILTGIISSPENQQNMDAIRASHDRLADPRTLGSGEEGDLISGLPTIGWFGYSIHGDEMSGVDGGIAFAYYLIAGMGEEVESLLKQTIVVIDPMMNPDGRERYKAMLEMAQGFVPNRRNDGMHQGRWPYGRGNHYIFDMNRDWMPGTQPETRARWKAALRYRPQLFVDAHEMGSLDTFLFSPPRPPLNPNLPNNKPGWNVVFAADQAAAFDRYGWSYYSREWFESWYPGYSDAWGSLQGAIGILYEQARLGGQAVRKREGTLETYREAAHHQAISSLANLRTLAANRESILRDYLGHKRRFLDEQRMFVFAAGRNPAREAFLLRALLGQGVEVFRAKSGFRAPNAESSLGGTLTTKEVAAGSYIVPANQPTGALIHAYLDFDPRLDVESLKEEREEIEQRNGSNIYDVTAWSLAHVLDLEAYWCDAVEVEAERVEAPPNTPIGISTPRPNDAVYAWIVDGDDDRSVRFAVEAMYRGVAVHAADREFTTAGRSFPRGSLLVRYEANTGAGEADDVEKLVRAAAEAAGVVAFPTTTGRSPDEGPDLGGGHFGLLVQPRVALLAGGPVASDRFGHIWQLIDHDLRLGVNQIEAASFSRADLRAYNVIVLPPVRGSLRGVLGSAVDDLETWVRSGGTLIALGGAAAALADEDLGISSVRRRRDVLEDLPEYLRAAARERAAFSVTVDENIVWSDIQMPRPEMDEPPEVTEEEDSWLRRFAPRGVTLRSFVDTQHWLTFGAHEELPVFYEGGTVLLTRSPVETPIRLAQPARVRLGGLVWPEARERLGYGAWLTREGLGNGQVILFAAQPSFRGAHRATARLLANAIAYGPGLGARAPLGW